MNEHQIHLRRVTPVITQAERQALASYPPMFWQGFDTDDILRLIIYRRAVRAGYYNDGPADERWVRGPLGRARLVTA